jgi:sigma-B regulation protein RsbU (phosphoserine phosphatase)
MTSLPAEISGDLANTAAAAVTGARVLVVDDIEANRELLIRRLKRLGVSDILQAPDGRVALDIIQSTPLDLVLLDIMMPVMTGFDVLEAMARERRTLNLPVIVISAMNEMDAIIRAIGLGAEDFLLKPFDPTLLRARVLATLEKKQLRDQVRNELARKQGELAEARALQLGLAPPSFRDQHCGLDVVLEPAREIGGDLVDHAQLPDGRRLIVLGDVSDKGASAALVMARTHAMVRSLAARPDAAALFADPALAARELNLILSSGNPSCMFVTMLLAVFSPVDGRLDYVRCGHIPPFLRRADGRVLRLDVAGGPPLGVSEDVDFVAGRARLAPGDVLLILSDGVTEAESPAADMFGDEGVLDWIAAGELELSALVALVRAHEAGGPPSDDVAALLLKFHSHADDAELAQ